MTNYDLVNNTCSDEHISDDNIGDYHTSDDQNSDSVAISIISHDHVGIIHTIHTKDGRRIWLDKNTDDWNQYADDYKSAHNGLEPPTQWGGDGTWFNLVGETQFR